MSFHFSGYVPGADTTELTLNEAKLTEAEQELSHLPYSYELGEVIREDLNGNGIVDAGVEIERYQGNAYDIRWYMWIATEDGPEQSPVPFARSAHCGDVVADVTPVDGGLEVHEFLRYPSDEAPARIRDRGSKPVLFVPNMWKDSTSGGLSGLTLIPHLVESVTLPVARKDIRSRLTIPT